jgi:hypothetical protein
MVTLRVIDTKRDLARPPAVALDGVSITYGGEGGPVYEAVQPVDLDRSATASSSRCSGPPAAASRPCSTSPRG